jgi:Periplasmic binding protein
MRSSAPTSWTARTSYFESVGNAAGGRAIQIIREDEGVDPAPAVQKVRKLIEQDKVDVFTGIVFPRFPTTDHAPHLPEIQTANPEATYNVYSGSDAVNFVKQYDEFGFKKDIKLTGSGSCSTRMSWRRRATAPLVASRRCTGPRRWTMPRTRNSSPTGAPSSAASRASSPFRALTQRMSSSRRSTK